jgi:tetratricopeptide (TPR) repeat protein
MRFDKLEFERPPDRPNKVDAEPRVEKDEKYWVKLADENRRTGSYETALRFYSRALEIDKTLVPAWVGQVQMLIHLQEYPQASLWSQKALEIFPSNGELMASQAQGECRMGNMKKAYSLSDGALRQRGESAYRWQVRGELVVAGKQRNDRYCFDKAQLADKDWLVPLESALIYMHYSNHSMAQQRAQMAVEKAPQAYYPWYVLGLCQTKLGFDSAALSSFNRCVQLCPRHDDALSRIRELETPQWPFSRLWSRLRGR